MYLRNYAMQHTELTMLTLHQFIMLLFTLRIKSSGIEATAVYSVLIQAVRGPISRLGRLVYILMMGYENQTCSSTT